MRAYTRMFTAQICFLQKGEGGEELQGCIQGHDKDPKRHIMLERLDKFRVSPQARASGALVAYWEALTMVKRRLLEALAVVRALPTQNCLVCSADFMFKSTPDHDT
jgi:hypothetical protein